MPLVYEAGSWEIDAGQRELRSRGVSVAIGARAFEVLEGLADSAGALVSKDTLIARVWPGINVEENTLQVHIAAIRKALGSDRVMLKTVTGRGYRLLGDWRVRGGDSAKPTDDQYSRRASGDAQSNLPSRVTSLIGRLDASRLLRDLLTAYRVVTLTGSGGIGKTALAVEVARGIIADFGDGVWLVGLADILDPDLVASAVTEALGLKFSGETISAEAVARAIGTKTMLLVLDNCEHVINAASALAETIVRDCPNVTVLATSREVLKIAGECAYRVPPLDIPVSDREPLERMLKCSAVELFVARTQALDAEFSPREDILPSITTICRRLDGIPLAIEFAAAQAATLGAPQVAAGLSDRFKLLTSRRRTVLPRHQTLRAALDWSYALLSEQEKTLLRGLAIFAGGFNVDAVVAISTTSTPTVASVADNIANLVAKSLVVFDGATTPNRWRLLETIRAYAREKLVESGEVSEVAPRHAEYFRNLFTGVGSGSFLSPTIQNIDIYTREIDNVRAALDWCFSPEGDTALGVDLTATCAAFYLHLSLMAECRSRCERALLDLGAQTDPGSQTQMRLQIVLGITLQATMAPAEYTKSVLTKALAAAEVLDDADAQARVLWALAGVYFYREEYDAARAAAARLGDVAHRIGNRAIILGADRLLGIALFAAGRLAEARERLDRVLQSPPPPDERRPYVWHFSRSEDRALTRTALARTLLLQGFPDEALRQARMSLGELRGPDRQLSYCRSLYQGMCRISLLRGDLVEAEQAITTLIETAMTLKAPFLIVVGHFFQGKLLVDQREFAHGVQVLQEAFATCETTGWQMSRHEFKAALAEALAGAGQLDDALTVVNESIAAEGKGEFNQVWYLPELLRIKGELLLQRGASESMSAAEHCFDRALAMARRQGALFWELRTALSLARLRVSQSRQAEARQALAPAFERFKEGFGTADLRAAGRLLDAMSQ